MSGFVSELQLPNRLVSAIARHSGGKARWPGGDTRRHPSRLGACDVDRPQAVAGKGAGCGLAAALPCAFRNPPPGCDCGVPMGHRRFYLFISES
ncbi:hypothetical protein A3768_0031 [Ralstonia solanacearum]|nr:hypothetical protein F504_3466 [Ralstonia pseudosolanacearum FQY_4]ANH31224.1 hypothetical protein A3768_0031 [Ralstonia solanacearum]